MRVMTSLDRHPGWKKGDGISYPYEGPGPDAEAIEVQ